MNRVYLRFERIFDQWRVSFRPMAGNDRLREFCFADGSKVEQMIERAGGLRDLATKQAFETGLRNGLGGLELRLTAEQYARLKR